MDVVRTSTELSADEKGAVRRNLPGRQEQRREGVRQTNVNSMNADKRYPKTHSNRGGAVPPPSNEQRCSRSTQGLPRLN